MPKFRDWVAGRSAVTIADNDELYVRDDDTNDSKRITWGNAKTALGSTFSTAPQRALLGRLSAGAGPAIITVLGDSTSNGDTDWFVPVLDSLGGAFPAFTVQHRLWSHANQSYGAPVYRQVGTAGLGHASPVSGGINQPAVAGNTRTSPSFAFRARIQTPASWALGTLVSQFGNTPGAAGDRAYQVYIASTFITYRHVADDGTQTDYVVFFTALPTSTDVWIGGTFNASTGVWQPQTSVDGVTWTALGTATTGVTQSDLNPSNYQVQVGARSGTSEVYGGRVYWLEVYDGPNASSPMLLRFDSSLRIPGQSTLTDAEGRAWSLGGSSTFTDGAPVLLAMNGSTPGETIAYARDATRQPKLASAASNMFVMNWGHNESAVDVQSTYGALVGEVLALRPSATVVVNRQNPQHSTATHYLRQNRHQSNIGEMAARNGYGVIDAHRAFLDTGNSDAYVGVGDVHPTAAGYVLWSNTARRSFGLPAV